MKKINATYLLLIVLIVLQACSAGKKSTSNVSGANDGNKIKAERIFFSGIKEKIKENYSEALRQFEQSVKIYPKNDAAFYEISLIKYSQNDYASALSNIESALKIDATNKWYRELSAELYSANQKYDKAADVYKSLRTEKTNKTDYYYSEAFFLVKQGKNKEAIKVYNLIEQKIGVQEEITNEKYLIYLRGSNLEEAENELVKLKEAHPSNLKYLNKLASFHLANKQAEKAIVVYKTILEKDPNDAKALMSLADYSRNQGDEKKYSEYAKRAFSNKSIGVDTKIAILYNYIQESEKDATKLKDAYEYAELLTEAHPEEAKVWAIYGDIYNIDQQPKKALENYKKSLELRKDIFSVWQQAFFIQSDAKQFDELIEYTEEAKELFPNQSLLYFFNGLAYQEKKNLEESNMAYEKGLKMVVNNPNLKSQFYSNLGENYNNLKNYNKSDENFDKSLELNPKNQYVLNNFAYYLSIRSEKLDQAKKMSLLSLDLSPDNPTYLDTYAWILYKNKEYKNAYKFQEKAIELSEKPSAALFEHLGDMLFQLDRVNEAVLNWEKAKSGGNNSKELQNKITNKKID
jgi:tetratricopeptide (TPR) repeat protein